MMATVDDCLTVPKPCAREFESPRGHYLRKRAGEDLPGKPVVSASISRVRTTAGVPRTGSQCNEKRPSAVVDRGRTKLPVAEAAGVEAAALIDDMADDGWRAA